MATAMPAAKGLGPGDQSIVPDEDSRQSRSKQNSVSAPSAAQGSAQAGQAGSASSSQHPNDRDRKIGHRRVNENGEVSYKKVTTNQLMGSIQLGIGHAIGALAKADDRDLLMQDFMTVETTHFPKNGSQQTPAHSFSEYTFRTYAPLAFRYFLNLFGIQREDFLVSLVNYNMRELSNPGASGSIFYLTYDDEFILKTVQHKEAEFLQKLLPGYYMNLNQNPHTLLPKFFGMYMYQCNQKNIRVIIMNNLLPSNIKMHMKFDLKGSTFKRKAGKHERSKSSPTYKDLDFMELLPEGLMLEAETYNALITTMRRDCRVLESFRIMDYSLLIGVHNLDQSAKEQAESISGVSPTKEQARREAERKMQQYATKQKLVSGPMESIQAQTEPIDEQDHLPPGGIPARNHKGERLLLYLGIIDILQSYRMRKKIEHVFKAMLHDGDTVSVHRPGFYAHRFLDFMADKVFKKIPSLDLPEVTGTHRKFRSIVSSLIALKHSPSKRGKRDSIKKIVQDKSEKVAAEQLNTTGASSLEVAEASANVSSSSPPQPSNELGQLRGAAAIGVSLKSSKLFAAAAAAHNSSLETENNSEDASEAACGEPEKQPPQPQSPLQPPSSSQFPIQQQQPHSLQTASSQMVTFEDKTVFLESEAAAAAAAASIMLQNSGCSLAAGGPETLNIPAVLWDRPSGSSKRVPPPVPPRSPRRPYDHEASFAAATDVTRGQRPDVVPGSVDDCTADSEESGIVAGTSSFRHHHNSGGKPKHKRQDQVQQSLSYNHSSLGDLYEHRPPSSVNQGTPSHLSIGTSSIHTTTWTEGTPSYTESSLSGSLGRASADPGRVSIRNEESYFMTNHTTTSTSLGSRINCTNSNASPVRKSFFQSVSPITTTNVLPDGRVERRLETCSYQETEM